MRCRSCLLFFFFLRAGLADAVMPALLQTVLMEIFSAIYKKMAVGLTNIENHRTQKQYNDNLVIKLFLFEFVNRFAPLLYLAYLRNGWDGNGFAIFGNEGKRR